VERYIKRNGIEYLREKITLTELEPRENAARYFMAALRDDFKLPVRREPEKEAASEASHPTFLGGAATSNGRGADSENGDDARTPPDHSRLSELKMQWISMLRVETRALFLIKGHRIAAISRCVRFIWEQSAHERRKWIGISSVLSGY
jgi:hypothetical protein